jgi:phosphopantetheinyl transferase
VNIVRKGADEKPRFLTMTFHEVRANVAASREMVVLAIGAVDIGVDVEPIQSMSRWRHIGELLGVERGVRTYSWPAEAIDVATVLRWCRIEADIKRQGSRLYDALAEGDLAAREFEDDIALFLADHVCVVATEDARRGKISVHNVRVADGGYMNVDTYDY